MAARAQALMAQAEEEESKKALLLEQERLNSSQEVVAPSAAELVDNIFPLPVPPEKAQIHPYFTNFFTIVILANCVQIGAECQWKREDAERLLSTYKNLDLVFVSLFTAEIVIKFARLGVQGFFFDSQKAGESGTCKMWNVLDLALTGAMLLDMTLALVRASHDVVKLLGRISRLGRCLRLIRVLRVLKAQPELVVVVEGLLLSSTALMWILLALSIFLYFFAIMFVLQVDHDIFANVDLDDDADVCEKDPYFCNLSTAMLTLLNVVVGAEWTHIIQPLLRHQPVLVIPFLTFFVIASFGIVNIIVGVIVDATAETKTRIQWGDKRDQLVHASSMWFNTIVSKGLSLEQLHKLKSDGPENEYLDAKKKRDADVKQLIERMLEMNVLNLPDGTRAESVLQLLDRGNREAGELNHEDFTTSLGRLLLADQEGLAMIGLVNQAKQFAKVREMYDILKELQATTLAAKAEKQTVETNHC